MRCQPTFAARVQHEYSLVLGTNMRGQQGRRCCYLTWTATAAYYLNSLRFWWGACTVTRSRQGVLAMRSSIEAAISATGRGELTIVTDDERRVNEGDLIMAAQAATPEEIAFMLTRYLGRDLHIAVRSAARRTRAPADGGQQPGVPADGVHRVCGPRRRRQHGDIGQRSRADDSGARTQHRIPRDQACPDRSSTRRR